MGGYKVSRPFWVDVAHLQTSTSILLFIWLAVTSESARLFPWIRFYLRILCQIG